MQKTLVELEEKERVLEEKINDHDENSKYH
jgi:hypothetical protein